MKAYVLESVAKLEWKEVERPALKDGEVLVEVKAAGVCGSDIPRIFQTGTYHFPTIPGHEFSGNVVEAYGERESVWLGKRVGVFPLIPCGTCSSCEKQAYEMCSNYNYLGSRCDGGFAEYVAVPVWNLIELPDEVRYEEAAMLEPASVALHVVRKLDLSHVKKVALLGLGTIGSIIVQWLADYGIEEVLATGHRAEFGTVMKEVADEHYQYLNAQDADVVSWITSATDGQGVDIVIDCIGSEQSLADSIASVTPGGQILIVANPKGDVSLPKNVYWQILRKQIRLFGTWNSSFWHSEEDDWHQVLKACCEKRLRLSELITHKFSFEQLHDGLDVMRQKNEYRNKVMICNMNDSEK